MSSYLAFPPSPRMPWGMQKARFFTRSRTRVRQRGKTRLNKRIKIWNFERNSYLNPFLDKMSRRQISFVKPFPRLLFCALHDSLGSLFLLHFPDGYPWLTLSVILPYEARTFLTRRPFGMTARDRSAKLFIILYH